MITSETDKKLTEESSPIVEILKIINLAGIVNLQIPYKVVCDFSKIPEEQRSLVFQILTKI
jgi:hypothetical protein